MVVEAFSPGGGAQVRVKRGVKPQRKKIEEATSSGDGKNDRAAPFCAAGLDEKKK